MNLSYMFIIAMTNENQYNMYIIILCNYEINLYESNLNK